MIKKYHIKWFRCFGLAYWCDTYKYPFNVIADKTHNIVILFFRLQIRVRKTVLVKQDGTLEQVTDYGNFK